jgi:hypothetical protein
MTKPVIYTARTLEDAIELDYDAVLESLRSGEILEEHGLMRWGSNYTFLVSVRDEKHDFMAIYKPRMGERPLWDFPDGTLCQRETASFVLSEMLGWHIVPPTVLREAPRGAGSIQVFINHDPQRHFFTFDETHIPQIQRMALFDVLVNNADRKGGHCLLDETERVWGIDHGLTFHPAPKLRTVIWDYAGEPIPDELLTDLRMLCTKLDDDKHPQQQQFSELLNAAELRALSRRIDQLLQTGVYPMPGPGPNRPWPAI